MSSPNIKVHLVPPEYSPTLDVGESYDKHDIKSVTGVSSPAQRECKLIERAVNGRWFSLSDPNPDFPRHSLIKLIQDSTDVTGKTFIIDYTTEQTGYPTADFFAGCNWVQQTDPIGNPTQVTEQQWVTNHREFGSFETTIINLQYQLFIDKPSNFVGIAGATPGNISLPYTFIPRTSPYSFNLNEYGYPAGGASFIGDLYPIYPVYNSTTLEYDWGGSVNFTIEYSGGKNKVVFSQLFFDNFIRKFPNNPSDTSVYNLYFRGHVYRDNNIHSTSVFGALHPDFTDSVYYAIPHDDIVTGSTNTSQIEVLDELDDPITTPSASILFDQGLIAFSFSDRPDSEYSVYLNEYQYHRWIRFTNDMTDNLVFNTYSKGTTQIQIYNYDNSDDPTGLKGLRNNATVGEVQVQQDLINYNWGDIKVTNEAEEDLIDPPNLLDMYIDAFPRGKLSGAQDNEQIIQGQGGLVSRNKPWDHQEGNRIETDQACFIRVVRDYALLYNKPADAPNTPPGGFDSGSPQYANPMYQMNASQAWRIKQWYANNVSQGTSGRRFLLEVSDNIMASAQTGSSITMEAGDIIYARVIHILFDGTNSVRTPVASAPKAWSIGIRGDFLSGS